MGILLRALLAGLAALPAAHAGVTRDWPGTACPGTLQACVEASASGDQVRIATNDPVDEDIDLGDRGIALIPATTLTATYRPNFAPGRSIHAITSAVAGDIEVTLRGLRLVDGSVTIVYLGSGTAGYELRDLDLAQRDPTSSVNIRVQAMGGTVTAELYGNHIAGDPAAYGGSIELFGIDTVFNAYAAFNRIEHGRRTDKKTGIAVEIQGDPADAFVRVFGNDLRLAGASSDGIVFTQLAGAAGGTLNARAYSNVVRCAAGSAARGIAFAGYHGALDVQGLNNTVDRCRTGIRVVPTTPSDSPTFAGLVWNNLVVAEDVGLEIGPGAETVANDYNLVNAASNAATLGPHSTTAPAGLGVATRPRPAAGSPAIDAADAATLANGIIDNGFPLLDADGLRRSKGTRADIGAYEFGDVAYAHVADAANTSNHVTTLTDETDGASILFATRAHIVGDGIANSYETFGVWFNFPIGHWTIYHEDTTVPIAPGKRWHVFAPAAGGGVFTHAATAANTSAARTQIDSPVANGLPNQVLLVRHDFSLDVDYHDHPAAIIWTGSGTSGRWNIGNVDNAAMDVDAGFNVYAQPPSPNAFRTGAATLGAHVYVLDHPLLNGVACANPQVTMVRDAFESDPIDDDFIVEYETLSSVARHWLVRTPTPFRRGVSFNVVIDPAQVAECSDVLFADGFDG
jgi:hypothetical protein